jgi:hypothetical protein
VEAVFYAPGHEDNRTGTHGSILAIDIDLSAPAHDIVDLVLTVWLLLGHGFSGFSGCRGENSVFSGSCDVICN